MGLAPNQYDRRYFFQSFRELELFLADLRSKGDITVANLTVDNITLNATLRLTSGGDASLSSTNHPLQIGSTGGLNLIIDNNEIMARNNGAASTLNLNIEGGNTSIGGGVSVQGQATFSGPATVNQGLTFPATQVPSGDPHVLDDYEEGTWTPTVIGTTVAGTGAYSQNDGLYVKIGKFVWVSCQIVQTAHTGTGNMRITGMPFVNSVINPPFTFWHSAMTFTGQTMSLPSGTSIIMYNAASGAATGEMPMDTVCTLRVSGWYQTSG